MKKSNSISVLHVILLSMTLIGMKAHVAIIPPLIQVGGRDGWVSVILATLVMLPWGFLLVYIHKKTNQKPINTWLKEKIGKVNLSVFLFIIITMLLLLAGMTMRETIQFVTNTFLTETPFIFLLTLFVILCVMLASSGIQTIVIVNVIVLFGVLVFGFFAAFTNLQVKDHSLLLPFFEDGLPPVLKGMVFPASAFVELIFLYLFNIK